MSALHDAVQRARASGLRLGTDYPHPIVDHARARERTLERFSCLSKQT